jgi:simple sugar transport system permease protein
LAGGAFSVVFAFLVVILRANQVVTGIMMVMFGSGLTGLLGIPWTDKGISGLNRLNLGILSEIPVLGPIVFRQDFVVYLTIIIVIVVWYVLHRTMIGMRLRAVGENPQAADASGINVTRYRFYAVVVGGMLVGLGGGYLTLASSKIWVADVTSGRGWIVVALVIFARWMPGRALFGAVLFGFIEALIPRIMTTGAQIPQYLLLSTPYLATLFVLIYAAVASKRRSVAPGALGIPYVREDRS